MAEEVCFIHMSFWVAKEAWGVILPFIRGSNHDRRNCMPVVARSFVSYFAAFSPEGDNRFNVLPYAAPKPWKWIFDGSQGSLWENQKKWSKYARHSFYNTCWKKIKCVLEERSVWALLATGLSGFLLPDGKATPHPFPAACGVAAVTHPSLQCARCFQSLISLLLLLGG